MVKCLNVLLWRKVGQFDSCNVCLTAYHIQTEINCDLFTLWNTALDKVLNNIVSISSVFGFSYLVLFFSICAFSCLRESYCIISIAKFILSQFCSDLIASLIVKCFIILNFRNEMLNWAYIYAYIYVNILLNFAHNIEHICSHKLIVENLQFVSKEVI